QTSHLDRARAHPGAENGDWDDEPVRHVPFLPRSRCLRLAKAQLRRAGRPDHSQVRGPIVPTRRGTCIRRSTADGSSFPKIFWLPVCGPHRSSDEYARNGTSLRKSFSLVGSSVVPTKEFPILFWSCSTSSKVG